MKDGNPPRDGGQASGPSSNQQAASESTSAIIIIKRATLSYIALSCISSAPKQNLLQRPTKENTFFDFCFHFAHPVFVLNVDMPFGDKNS